MTDKKEPTQSEEDITTEELERLFIEELIKLMKEEDNEEEK